jgi:apolipoprotein N-acyltransferase
MSERELRWNSRLLFGLVILTLGVLFTLDNFGVIDSRPILRWWPAILVLVGLSKLLGIGTTRNLIWGATFTLFGTLWLGRSVGFIHFDVWDLWPVFMVALGASFLFRGMQPQLAGVPGGGDPADVVHGFASCRAWIGASCRAFRGDDVRR